MTPSQPPDHTIGIWFICFLIALAVPEQYATKSLVGENAGEVVDPAISFGFADDSNDFVGLEQSGW